MEKLSQILSPITSVSFFDLYFRKLPLFISEEKDFDWILTTEEINEYFNRPSLLYPLVRVVGNGQEIDLKQYSLLGNQDFNILNKKMLLQLFGEGSTLVIQGAQYQFKNLQQLISSLEAELKLEINANIYITPSSSKGFYPHFDLHEVLVLQINGTKKWNIYHDIPIEAPIKGSIPSVVRDRFLQMEPEHRLQLQPGDVLYIPRGVVHEAFCEDEPSIHITLGFNPLLKIDIMSQLLKQLEDIPYFREPFSTLKEDFDPAMTSKEMGHKATALLKNMISSLPPYEYYKTKYYNSNDKFALLFGIDNLTEEDIKQLDVKVVLRDDCKTEDNEEPLLEFLRNGNSLLEYMQQENVPVYSVKATLKSLLKREQIRLQF